MSYQAFSIPNEIDLTHFAVKLAPYLKGVIFLQGELGVGKTTFTRLLLQALGHDGKVKSPTYSLVESYAIAGRMIHHFDLYRLKTPKELIELDLEFYVQSGDILFFEWPDKGECFIPKPDLICHFYFRVVGEVEGRTIELEANSSIGHSILTRAYPNLTI